MDSVLGFSLFLWEGRFLSFAGRLGKARSEPFLFQTSPLSLPSPRPLDLPKFTTTTSTGSRGLDFGSCRSEAGAGRRGKDGVSTDRFYIHTSARAQERPAWAPPSTCDGWALSAPELGLKTCSKPALAPRAQGLGGGSCAFMCVCARARPWGVCVGEGISNGDPPHHLH